MTVDESHRLVKLWRGFTYYVSGIYNRADSHHIFLMAGGLAFSMFVCIIPLLLIILYVLGNFVEQPEVLTEIDTIIDGLIPYGEYSNTVKEEIALRLQNLADFKEVAGIVGFLGIFIAGSGLFSSLRTVLGTVFKQSNDHSALIGKLWDFALIIIVLIFFLLLMFAIPLVEAAVELTTEFTWLQDYGLSTLQSLLVNFISFATIFLTFSIVYWIVPVRRVHLKIVLISALIATLLWKMAEELFGLYIHNVATLKHIYGFYAFLVIVAFWIYYSALTFIAAAEIGQLYGERNIKEEKPPSRFFRDEIRPM